jgi:hypothetical protein
VKETQLPIILDGTMSAVAVVGERVGVLKVGCLGSERFRAMIYVGLLASEVGGKGASRSRREEGRRRDQRRRCSVDGGRRQSVWRIEKDKNGVSVAVS